MATFTDVQREAALTAIGAGALQWAGEDIRLRIAINTILRGDVTYEAPKGRSRTYWARWPNKGGFGHGTSEEAALKDSLRWGAGWPFNASVAFEELTLAPGHGWSVNYMPGMVALVQIYTPYKEWTAESINGDGDVALAVCRCWLQYVAHFEEEPTHA